MSICTWSNEETDDNVLGSGADSYSWYPTPIELGKDFNGYLVMIDDPNGEEESIICRRVARPAIRRIVTEVIMGKHEVSARIRNYLRDDDADADAMDCVIQIATLGEIVYG